ncbi:MAG: threonine ammonia-lyase [Bacteroidales bacterium]|nr:threonine ammonia-lyase [Bacteroidales bacterium]
MNEVITTTPLIHTLNLSERYEADILLKREDLQLVRSYKIRGAYNKIRSLSKDQLSRGVVCASAGNHAQGVAYSCQRLNIHGTIYMPVTTPKQKVKQVSFFGRDNVDIVLAGDTFDESYAAAIAFTEENNKPFIHPFDDPKIIEGQATVALEIIEASIHPIDYIFVPVGGGGLAAGVASYIKEVSPQTKVIGVEPAGAASMRAAMDEGHVVRLEKIDKFVDGAAVKQVGNITYDLCSRYLDDVISVPEGKVCTTIIELYNLNAIVAEPAGALSIAALDFYADKIKGKNVVCIVSGNNNDITRTEEIRERSLLYEGLKHYFLIRFPQRSGVLMNFLQNVLGPKDDITHFDYSKKTNREEGPAIVGLELQNKEDFQSLIERMDSYGIVYEYLNNDPDLFGILI